MALTAFLVAGTATVSLGLMITSNAATREARAQRESQAAALAAEAGLNAAYVDFVAGGVGALASEQNPMMLGGAEVFVEAVEMGDDIHSLVATGRESRAGARMQLILRRAVEVTPMYAAFGDEGVTMDSNAFVDSYNSSDGDYDSQAVNADGNDRWANENGNVGSNANIDLRQNSGIHGDATPGPAGSVSISGNAAVTGSTVAAAEPQDMPPLEIPEGTPSGDYSIRGSGTLGPGTFFYDQFLVERNSTLDIVGPITLVVNSFEIESGSELLVDAVNGGADIYVYDDFVLNSNTLLTSTTGDPADITVNLNSDNVIDPDETVDLDAVDFESNAMMFGTIYAPNALVEINSNFELFGAVVARRVHLDSNSKIHFDENLMEADADADFTVDVLFRRALPYSAHGEQVTPGLEPSEDSIWQQEPGYGDNY